MPTLLPSRNLKSIISHIRLAGTTVIVLTLLLASSAQLKAQTYMPIIYPGSIGTIAHGINALGQIVGEYQDSGGAVHGFIYGAGIYTSFDYPGASSTVLFGINNAGDMVGYHDFLVGFFYKAGTGTFTATTGVGSAINNFDFIPVGDPGFLQTPTSQPTAITYPGSTFTDSRGFSDAFQVVGFYDDQTNAQHGFSYNFINFTTIDAPGYSVTAWNGVNTLGDMVGTATANNLNHAVLDSGGTFTQVDYHPSSTNHFNQANAINDFGQIVGETPGTFGQPATIGFLRLPPATNPVPFISQPLVPSAVLPGSAGFTLTVEGTGFVPGAVVKWNGTSLTTTFQNISKLTATVSAADVAAKSTATVTVVNPGPGGGTSNTRFFQITSPVLTPTFTLSNLSAGSSPQRNIAADFNRDGIMDLAAADGPNNKVLVMLGNGDGTFQSPTPYQVGTNPSTLIAADFNNDGKLDIAVGDSDGGIYVLQGNGDGTFHVDPIISVAGAGPWDLAVGDFNGDGRLDLACVNQTDSTISIFLGNGDPTFNGEGFFQPPATLATNAGPGQLTVGDFNGDGKLDLAVANFGSFSGDTVSVFLGNGNGTFHPKVDYNTSLAPLSVVAADFNGDGKLDLAVANSCGSSSPCGRPGSVSILLGNGDGTFGGHTDYPAGFFPYTITAGDVNGDGKFDVAVSDLDSGQVTILSGVGDGTFANPTALVVNGSPVGLISADFNGDGKLDFAVGTSGGVQLLLQNEATTTSLSASANPAIVGQLVTFTASVTGHGATPTGSITFNQNGAALATVPMTNGQASYAKSFGSAGTKSFTATYSGDSNNTGSTSAALHQVILVSPATTSTMLSSSSPTVLVGQPVTFTATVSSTSGSIPNAELVTFKDVTTNVVLGTAPLSGGVATLTTSTLAYGSHSVKAKYAGDTDFLGSTATITQIVQRYPATMTLGSNPNPSNVGQSVTFTAVVFGHSPTGTITFLQNGTALATVPMTNGQAVYVRAFGSVGTKTFTATYSGDSNNKASTAAPLSQVVQ